RHTRFSRDWSSDVCSSDLMTTEVTTEGAQQQPATYRVLLVEDDPAVARGLARLLMARGLSVDIALSCSAARSLPGHFDLGIFDIELTDRSEERRVGQEGGDEW